MKYVSVSHFLNDLQLMDCTGCETEKKKVIVLELSICKVYALRCSLLLVFRYLKPH